MKLVSEPLDCKNIEPFYTNKVVFLENEDKIINNTRTTVVPSQQSLNMQASIFSSTFDITHVSDHRQIMAEMSLYCPRQLPLCSVQTINITPIRSTDITDLYMDAPFFHQVFTKQNIIFTLF